MVRTVTAIVGLFPTVPFSVFVMFLMPPLMFAGTFEMTVVMVMVMVMTMTMKGTMLPVPVFSMHVDDQLNICGI